MQVNTLSRTKEVSVFPWIKDLRKKFLSSFPEIKQETLLVLHEKIAEELEKLLAKPNRSRTRLFYRLLSDLYLYFCWKIDWSVECHVKSTCVLILYYMSHLGLILSRGDVYSDWFSQTLTGLQCLPGDPFVVCDVLLLFRNMKKKYHLAYSEILKLLLFDRNMRKPLSSESFVKAMLLFRRLKFLSKGKAKSEISFYASKIECPADLESWLSSLKIKRLNNIKCSTVAKKFLKKDLKCCDVKRLFRVLFSAKYGEKLISCKFHAKTQQNILNNKQVKKKFEENHKRKEQPNARVYIDEIGLNSGTVIKAQSKNHTRKPKNMTTVFNNAFDESKITISSDLKNENRGISIKQDDYQYLNSPEKKSAYVSSVFENSAAVSRKAKRNFSETEDINKVFLNDSTPVSRKIKKRKMCNKMNSKFEESEPGHSSLLNDNKSNQSGTDSVNELISKCENIKLTLSGNSKNISVKNGIQIHSEIQSCTPETGDLKELHLNGKSVMPSTTHKKKIKSVDLSIPNTPHLFLTKKVLPESIDENEGYLNSDPSCGILKKDRILDALGTNKYCKNSLQISQAENTLTRCNVSKGFAKSNMDYLATDKSYVLPDKNSHQCHQILHTKTSEHNVTYTHKNDCPNILNKNDHTSSSGKDNDRSVVGIQKILNKIDHKCEGESDNHSFSCRENTKIETLEHSQVSFSKNKEGQNSPVSPNSISPSKLQIREKTCYNNVQLCDLASISSEDIETKNFLSPLEPQNFEEVDSSPESLDIKTVPDPPVTPVLVNSLELSKSIYSTSDSSLKLTDEDESHGKGIQSKLSEYYPQAVISKIESKHSTKKLRKSRHSTKKLRRRRISKKFIESSCSSDNENKESKTGDNSNHEFMGNCNDRSSITDSESFKEGNSVISAIDKSGILLDPIKNLTDYSGKQKRVPSELESDLHCNHSEVTEQTKKFNKSSKIKKVLCVEQVNSSNSSTVDENSPKLQIDSSKRLSSTEGNVSKYMDSPVFVVENSSLLVENSSKNSFPMHAGKSKSLDLQSISSSSELQKYLSEPNLSFNSNKFIHKQLNDIKSFQNCQVVLSSDDKLSESISGDNFDHLTLRASSTVQDKQTVDDVHNLNESISDYLSSNFKMSLNYTPTYLPNPESFPESQKPKQDIILKEVQIILHDCLAPQNHHSMSLSPKIIAENLVSSKKDNSVSFHSTSKQKNLVKQKNRKLILESDSDTFDNERGVAAECALKSKFEDSLNSFESFSSHLKFQNKMNYKRCFIESDSEASVDNSKLHNLTALTSYPTSPTYSLRKKVPLSKEKTPRAILKTKVHSGYNTNTSRRSSQVLYSPQKGKRNDFILESASESDYDHSEYSSSSSSELISRKGNLRDFIIESASEDSDVHSEYSTGSLSSKSYTQVSHSNLILNSASEDNFNHDESEYLSSCPSSGSRSLRKDKSENLILETVSNNSTDNLTSFSGNPSIELLPSHKVRSKSFVLGSTAEDNSDISVSPISCSKVESKTVVEVHVGSSLSSLRSPSTKLKPSNRVISKTLVLKSASDDNGDNSMSSSRSPSPELGPLNKAKSKTYVLESASDDKADDSVYSTRSLSPESKHSNEIKSEVILSVVSCDSSCHDFEISPVKMKQKFTDLHNSRENISGFTDCLQGTKSSPQTGNNVISKSLSDLKHLLRSSAQSERKEESFPEIKKCKQADEFKEVQVILCNAENSSVSLPSRKLTENSATKETGGCLFSSKQRLKKRRISKNSVLESESDSFQLQRESRSKVDDSLNLCSSSFQFKSSKKLKHEKCLVESNSFVLANQNTMSKKSTSFNHSAYPSQSFLSDRNLVLKHHKPDFVFEDNKNQKYACNKSTGSTKEPNNIELSEIDDDLSANQTLHGMNEKSDVLVSDAVKNKCVLRESSESESSDSIPLLEIQKKLKNSVYSSVLSQNSDKLLLKNTPDCIQKCRKVSYISEIPSLSESPSSVYRKENLDLSKTTINSTVVQLTHDINEQSTAFRSVKRKDLEWREKSYESVSDLLEDIQEEMKNSPDCIQNYEESDLQKNLQFPEVIMKQQNTSSLKELKSSVIGSNLEQSLVSDSDFCCLANGNQSQKNLPNLNTVTTSRQEINFSPKLQNSLTEHRSILDVDKNMCNLVISGKEQYLAKDSFLDSSYLSDENFVQTLLDKVDPNILTGDDYLKSFVDCYLISSSAHTVLNDNNNTSDFMKSQALNGKNNVFKNVIPYSDTVNKSSQQNSELISNVSNTDSLNFCKIKESIRVEDSNMEWNALDVGCAHKNIALNSNSDLYQTVDKNTPQQLSSQCLNSSDNEESQCLDFDIIPQEEIDFAQNSDVLRQFQENSDSVRNKASFINTPKQGTQCIENKKPLEPLFCELDFEEAPLDRINMSLNSETSLEESQKDVSHVSKLNGSEQTSLKDLCTDEAKLLIKQSNVNNVTDTSEKILFVCDVENKSCQVHIMPQHLLVSFLNRLGNVSANQAQYSSNTQCNCPLCCNSSPVECDDEVSKNGNINRTQMGHICVNGIKILTSSLFPVVNLGKRCDEIETIKNSIEKQSGVSSPIKVLGNTISENSHRTVLKARKKSLCQKKDDSSIVKKENSLEKGYNLRSRLKVKKFS